VHYFVERAFGLDQGFWGLVVRGLSPDDLLALAEVACATSHVPLPAVPAGPVRRIQSDLRAFAGAWADVPRGGEVGLDWEG
jgi:hypothetical protein